MRGRILAAAAALLIAAPQAGAQQPCRQALALGLDVSGSVDALEYRLQLTGLAQALGAPPVRAKLLEMPAAPVHLLIYEWSGLSDQALLLPWTVIDSAASLDLVIETLLQTRRRAASPGTALGIAMQVGQAHLMQRPDCWKRTLDLSGDGKSNFGPRPRDLHQKIAASGITINGLVIGADNPGLSDRQQTEIAALAAYYQAEVILGPGAFVQTALGFEAYGDAMQRKLLRELEGLNLSRLD